jgi:hypothetical protein
MTTAQTGPGTPEYFYSVGGVGDEVTDAKTGEPLLNPQSGAPIVQEHPRVEIEATIARLEGKVERAEEALAEAKEALEAAEADLILADDRYDEILADLATKAATAPEPEG